MKKKYIFYIVFAFFIMFGLKANVMAGGFPDLYCVYKKENSKIVWTFQQDDKGKWTGYLLNDEDGYYTGSNKANHIHIEKQSNCPKMIYWNSGAGKGKRIGWRTSSSGGEENTYNLITLNLDNCYYKKDYSSIVWELGQSINGDPLLYLRRNQSGEAVVEASGTNDKKDLHFSVRSDDDSCPKNIYYLKNYWTQFGGYYDSSNSSHIKYNLVDKNYSSAISNDGRLSDLFCVYDDSNSQYLLRQYGQTWIIEFRKLGTNDTINFDLVSDGKDVSTGLIANCPLNIYLTKSGKYTNSEPSSSDLSKTLNLVKSAACFDNYNFEVKTEKNLYPYTISNSSFTTNLKNYTAYNKNDSIQTVCGNSATGYHVQQTLSDNKDVPTTVTCQYGKNTDTPFSITIDTSKKTFSVDVSKVSFCSGNNSSNPANTSQITYNDVAKNNLCNESIKLKVEKVSDGFCRIVKADDGDVADSSTNNEIKDNLKVSYTSIRTSDGSSGYSNTKYDSYTPVCGIFKPADKGGKLLPIIKNLYKIFKIAIPLLVVILTIVEFLKVLFSGEDKTMKDAFKATITRLILIVVLVFLPILIEFVIKIAGLSENCLQKFL